jgi:adenosylcobinamide-GDP ribazoletransferase
MAGLWAALSFLTILPHFPQKRPVEVHDWRGSALWFPIVGAIVGSLVWLVGWSAGQVFASWLAAALAVAAWAIITGGLHLDGLADCCDGLLAPVEAQQRRQIMRDPRVGVFGAIGLILFLVLKIGALQQVLSGPTGAAIILATVLGRVSILWLARQPAARAGGMGADFAQQIGRRAPLLASLPVLVLALLYGWRGVAAVVAALLATAGVLGFARRRIGGVSGDVYGLTLESVELAVLLVFAAQFP